MLGEGRLSATLILDSLANRESEKQQFSPLPALGEGPGVRAECRKTFAPLLRRRFDALRNPTPALRKGREFILENIMQLKVLQPESPIAQKPSGTDTHCPYCALQCGMTLMPELVELAGLDGLRVLEARLAVTPRDFPTNKGGLCRKGWTSTKLLHHAERLTSPLLRETKDAPLRQASWDEALDFVARKIEKIQLQYGRNAIGVFGGGGLTNEKSYWLGKFARVALKTANIDYNGRFCMASAASAGNKAFGIDRGLPFPLEDIPLADTILLIGSNPSETMPPIMQYFDAQKTRGGKLIVVDPRRTPTAENATLHLQIAPGTDIALALGLLHLCTRDRVLDHAFIAARTEGYREVRRVVANYWPEYVEQITGVPTAQLIEAAQMLGRANTAMVLTARGPEQQSKGVDTVLAFINLMLALGKVGKRGCGYGTITGQGNGQGGREHGQKCDQLPGYRSINDMAAREHMAQVWGVQESEIPRAGKSAYELLSTLGDDDGARALIVMGSNIAVSSPNSNEIKKRLQSLDLLVVADLFLSETAELADVVFPTTQWAEESGTMTNLEGRVLARVQAQQPPVGVWSDIQILSELAARLGCGDKFPTFDTREIFDELRAATRGGTADYSGITIEKIAAQDGVFWPCPDDGESNAHEGTPRLFEYSFPTASGRAQFHAVEYRAAGEEPDEEFPFYFTTGRVMSHYQSGTQTRRVGELLDASPRAFVEIHPAMAETLSIAEGETVRVVSRRGEALLAVKTSANLRQDTLFVPFHWGGNASANLLTNPALDPTSKMPEFKVCAARVEKINEPEA